MLCTWLIVFAIILEFSSVDLAICLFITDFSTSVNASLFNCFENSIIFLELSLSSIKSEVFCNGLSIAPAI